jgi:ABC-type transport system substrate-binding protein
MKQRVVRVHKFDFRQRQGWGRAVRAVVFLVLVIPILSGCSLSVPGRDHSTATVSTPATAVAVVPSESAAPNGGPAATPSVTNGGLLGTPEPSPVAKPTGSQTLTLAGGPYDPTTLDPALVRDADTSFIDRQIFRGVVKLSSKLDAQSDLADRVDLSQDQLTYTFHLRDGIKFQNGAPIRASDVQFSLERATAADIAQQAGGSIPALTFLSDIAGVAEHASGKAAHVSGISVVNDSTVKITLTHPVANFLVKLAGTPASIVQQSDVEQGGDWWRSPNASGPCGVSKWAAGQQLVLGANKNYLTEPPTLKTVTILFGAGASDPLTLYERGQIDVAPVPEDAVDRIEAENSPERAQLIVTPQLSESYVLINPNIAPFNDINVRKALIMGFDRAKIATVTYDGHVQVANGIVPAGLQGAGWTANIPGYDPNAAKALLAKTSVSGSSTPLTFYSSGDYAPVAMKLQYEADLGIKADVVQLEFQDYINDITAQKLPVLTLDWVADYPDPEDFLRTLFYSTSTENYIGYNNPDVDKLLDQAGAERDAAKRSALYEEAQQKIIDDAVVIPVYDDVEYQVIKPYVHGLDVTSIGYLGLETVWISK